MLVMTSPTAMRAEAAASITASGVRSPMAIASPRTVSKAASVTAQSATGTCQGPTIWSCTTMPPYAAVADRDQERFRRNGGQPQQALHCIGNRYAGKIERLCCVAAVRVNARSIFGGLPKSTCSGRSMSFSAPSVSSQVRLLFRVADDGERAALAFADRFKRRRGFRARWPARSAPAPRCTRSPAGSGPPRRAESRSGRRCRRSRHPSPARERRSTGRRRRHRG